MSTTEPSPKKVIAYAALALVVIALLSVGGWAFKVATSDIKGAGDATITKNSANNRIAAQERFEDLYQEVITADARIDVMADALARDKKSQIAHTNYAGTVTYCIDVRGDYDAEARKFTAADFRAIDLPAQIDTLNSDTDCKETQK